MNIFCKRLKFYFIFVLNKYYFIRQTPPPEILFFEILTILVKNSTTLSFSHVNDILPPMRFLVTRVSGSALGFFNLIPSKEVDFPWWDPKFPDYSIEIRRKQIKGRILKDSK